jgi:hypothetical protein
MTGRIHVVGAGVAGLAAALAATRQGGIATLYEAAPQAGGRCRTVRGPDGFAHDNGTHVLFAANRTALALLNEIGAHEDWIEPEPRGFPVYDAAAGSLDTVGLSPWSWTDRRLRPRGLDALGLLRLLRLGLPFSDRPVGDIVRDSALARMLVEPLCVAVLNTPMAEASARRLGTALRRLARPGAARLLVARRGLSADLVDPALRTLHARGAALHAGMRLRALVQEDGCVAGLAFADRTVPLGAQDGVVLALPPAEVVRLMPGLPVPEAYEPILNLHYRIPGPQRPRFVGLRGALAQWALVRADHVSITVSAASGTIDRDAEELARSAWHELAPALAALGLAAERSAVPEWRVVKEKRATIRQAAGPLPQPPVRPLANLALAGDWIGTLPATIESAAISGERAVAALGLRAGARGRADPGLAAVGQAP